MSIHRLEEFISLIMECYPGRPDREDTFNRYVEHGRDERIVQAAAITNNDLLCSTMLDDAHFTVCPAVGWNCHSADPIYLPSCARRS